MKHIFSSLVAMSLLACAGGNKAAEGRWQPYSGCGEEQCRSWNSGCEADCLNQGSRKVHVDANQCTAQCREKLNECTQSCTAKPGA